MRLIEALKLKEDYIGSGDLRAFAHCEKRWQEDGCPTERWPIINFLERMLRELQGQGGYPKALLLRKKEIQRKQFTVEQISQETCSCIGGWLLSGKPCPCPKGEPHRAQLRGWGMNV